jgi:hypothetical protein
MFDGLASIFDRFTPFSVYYTRHLVNAGVGFLGLWGTWRLGRLLGGSAVGFASLLMLVLTPMYYGHMFNNPKDIPFAAGVVWSLYYMGRCFAQRPNVSWQLIVKLGIVYGLTLGVRVGGLMLLFFWIGILKWDFVCTYWKQRPQIPWGALKAYLRLVIPVCLLCYAVMLFCWPWAQLNPIMNPLRALSEFSNFPQDVEVLLDGTNYRSTQLPWFYVPLYFGVQLPEFLFVLLVVGVVALPRYWYWANKCQRQLLSLMLLMAGFPLIYAMIRHPALYDAVRHFLFVVPLACVFSALTIQQVCSWGERNVSLYVFGVIGVVIVGLQASLMVRLHPYEYIYANSLAGGVTGAYGRYELDYWGSSFKEAAQELQSFVAKEGGVPPGKIYRVAICGPWSSAMIYLPPDYRPVVANEPAEFFLSTTRWLCPKMRPGRDIIEISRLGAPLAVIKDLRNGYEYYEGNEKTTK